MPSHRLAGVYVAALTPLNHDLTMAVDAIPSLLDFYAQRGCHGALMLGTTGEGPSFAPEERISIFSAAMKIREKHPGFRLMAGTGTPSLEETAELTAAAFNFGFDAAVVLPPYYFRSASDEGLFAWFREIIQRSVPSDGALLGYHIPGVSGVPLSLNLLSHLKDSFPEQFVGLKDSSGDPQNAQELGVRFGRDLLILTGNDRLLSLCLETGGAGSITAMANLFSPELRAVWEAYQRGEQAPKLQAKLNAKRAVMDRYQPFAPTLKALIAKLHGFPQWPVRPPLIPLSEEAAQKAAEEIGATAPLHAD